MEYALVVLGSLFALVFMTLGLIVLALLGLRRVWRRTMPNQLTLRSLVVALGIGLFVAPYVALKIAERRHVLARVPQPLEVAEIEFRLEELYGMGFMPGDNETGFAVYRLTDASAQWARDQGQRLGQVLDGTEGPWLMTPVDDMSTERAISKWHSGDDVLFPGAERIAHHRPNVSEFLGKYGFEIPIDEGLEKEVDEAIQSEGSLYRYGMGDNVTVIDPNKGKVYFFYAG